MTSNGLAILKLHTSSLNHNQNFKRTGSKMTVSKLLPQILLLLNSFLWYGRKKQYLFYLSLDVSEVTVEVLGSFPCSESGPIMTTSWCERQHSVVMVTELRATRCLAWIFFYPSELNITTWICHNISLWSRLSQNLLSRKKNSKTAN